MSNFKYFIIYKPFGILSQFSGEKDPEGNWGFSKQHICGVDMDSEGLLLLTDDKVLNHHLLEPKFRHIRTYLAREFR